MPAVIVIPARYDSTRFPGKPLAPLKGKPVIQHVYERSGRAVLAAEVIVATDSERIAEAVTSFGGKAVITSGSHASGTDRVAEVARSLDYDIIVNVQGDEPLIEPRMIDDVISLLSDRAADMGTLVKRIEEPEEIMNSNVVKAVFSEEGFALYFSRAPIPYHRDFWKLQSKGHGTKGRNREDVFELRTPDAVRPAYHCYKHIGLYSYRRDVLLALAGMRPTFLEETEKLEQLRALEHGFAIKVRETSFETIGVDTPKDLERVEKWLNSYS